MENLKRKTEEKNETRKKLEFVTCPCCGTGDLIEFGVDTICCHCDWNSAEMYVKEGLMDNRFLAFKEQFDPKNKIVRKYDQRVIRLRNHVGRSTASSKCAQVNEKSHEEFFNRAAGLV